MTPGPDVHAADARWREGFVEELGVLAADLGVPRAVVRVLGWLVVCDPAEQSAGDIEAALRLSAGSVSAATRTLVGTRLIERTARPGDRRIYYRLRPGGWEGALETRLRASTRLREVADRAVHTSGGEADERLKDMRDVYAWFEGRLDDLLLERRGGGVTSAPTRGGGVTSAPTRGGGVTTPPETVTTPPR